MLTKTSIQELTNNELTERMEGLLKNVYCQGSDFVIRERAIPFFKEAAEECTRRGIPHQSHLPEYTRPNDAPPILHTSALIRYGKRNHLEQLMRGVVSFGVTKQYEADVVAARRDYEDRCEIRVADGPLIIGGIEYTARNQKISKTLLFENDDPLQYHLLCASREESIKHCRDLHYEGFVKVADFHEFFALLEAEISRTYPHALFFGGDVVYYDELNPPPFPTVSDMVRHKTIKYMHQWEVRFALIGAPVCGQRLEIQIQPPKGLLEIKLFDELQAAD